MRILVADDNATIRRVIAAQATTQGFTPVLCSDGQKAFEILTGDDAPALAILDWEMPGLEGPEVCRRVRETDLTQQPYIMLVTVKLEKKDVVAAFETGVDDYLGKPFSVKELASRMQAGKRQLDTQAALRQRVVELEDEVSSAEGALRLLPACPSCHKIRGDEDHWYRIDEYLSRHPEAGTGTDLCPECLEVGASDHNDESAA